MSLHRRNWIAWVISLALFGFFPPVLPAADQKTDPGRDAQGDPLPDGALGRLGTVRFRTGGRILCLAYSPDGKLLAGGCGNDPVRLWDANTGRELRQIKEQWVQALAFSRDGTLLATGGGFKVGRLWNTATGQPVGPPLKGHQGAIKAVAFSPDGSLLATAGQDKTVRLWSVPTGQPVAILAGHEDEVNALAFFPDGKSLVSASGDRTLRVWQIPDGKPLHTYDAGCAVAALALARDGRTLASAGDDGVIRLWEMASGQETRQLRGHETSIVSLVFTTDGGSLITGDLGRTIRIWDLTTGLETRQLPRQPGYTDALALSPDGRVLAEGGTSNTVGRRDLSGKETFSDEGHRAGIASQTLTAGGKHLLSGSTAGEVRFWDLSRLKGLREPLKLGRGETLLTHAPDGNSVAVAEGANPVRLISSQTGEVHSSLPGPRDDPVTCLTYSPDGKLLAVGYRDHGVSLWKTDTSTALRQLGYAGHIHALAFAADGQTIAAGGTGKIILWQTSTGEQMMQMANDQPVACLAFSEDGLVLASGLYSAAIQLWDLRPQPERGKLLRTLEGHQSAVYALAFSRDGRALTSGSFDRTVRLWETASGQQIRAWLGHLGPVTAVSFLPDGRSVISGGTDTNLLWWDVTGKSSKELPATRLAANVMEGLWQDLASPDVPRAYRALWTLVAGATDAVPLLEKQKRVFLVDPEHVQQLLRDLNHNKFVVRERAYAELARYGRWIEGVLETAKKTPPSEEVRRRLGKLLEAMQVAGSITLVQERLRARRLMMVLEQSATPAARELLRKLSRQAAEADLRAEAKASLARFK